MSAKFLFTDDSVALCVMAVLHMCDDSVTCVTTVLYMCDDSVAQVNYEPNPVAMAANFLKTWDAILGVHSNLKIFYGGV